MNQQEIVARIEDALVAGWLDQSRAIDGAETSEFDGITLALTNIPFPPLNSGFVTSVPADPPAALARAAAWAAERGMRLSLDIPVGKYPEIEDACRDRGMRRIDGSVGMAVAVLEARRVSPPAAVELRQVTEPHELVGFRSVQVEAFGMPPEVVERFVPDEVLTRTRARGYLAFIDGEAVGSAVASEYRGTLAVFGVGVLEHARRRGIGAAITALCVSDARDDPDVAWLQASEEGLGVYRSLGFRSVGDWAVWGTPAD